MFDISFSELMIIGVIALIVIGPERLPKVARTVGHLLGRAQKYVNEVKSDIQSEMDMEEIGNIKKQMEDAAKSVKTSVSSSVEEVKSAVKEPTESLRKDLDEAKSALKIDKKDQEASSTDKTEQQTAATKNTPAQTDQATVINEVENTAKTEVASNTTKEESDTTTTQP